MSVAFKGYIHCLPTAHDPNPRVVVFLPDSTCSPSKHVYHVPNVCLYSCQIAIKCDFLDSESLNSMVLHLVTLRKALLKLHLFTEDT